MCKSYNQLTFQLLKELFPASRIIADEVYISGQRIGSSSTSNSGAVSSWETQPLLPAFGRLTARILNRLIAALDGGDAATSLPHASQHTADLRQKVSISAALKFQLSVVDEAIDQGRKYSIS